MSNINFTCPHCSHSVQLPADTLGKQGNCPGCKTMVQIVATPQQPLQQQPLQQPVIQPSSIVDPVSPAPSKQTNWGLIFFNSAIIGTAFILIISIIGFGIFLANRDGTTVATEPTPTPQSDSSPSNLLRFTPDIDDYGQAVLDAFKSGDIDQYWKTRSLSYDELNAIIADYNSIAKPKCPPNSLTREEFEVLVDKEKAGMLAEFKGKSANITDDVKYLACQFGRKRNYWEKRGFTDSQALEQLGMESANNGLVYAYDDTYLWTILLDTSFRTASLWFADGDIQITRVTIDDDAKADAKKLLETLTDEGTEVLEGELDRETAIRICQFIIDF
jgi:hypothetical protein